MPIHLYIEHLLNIRTLSIQASLPTSSTQTTHASISADKSTLTLTHDDETASIKLPINLSPRQESKISLDIPPVPQKELNFRVQLEEKENSELTDGLDREDNIVVPWTADQLTSDTEICCKACGSVVVERGKIKQWKDLPSEGWAEMMDFWHCHKPDHPDGPHDHGADGELKKGYAAGSRLALEPCVGMVDALHLVVVADDCINVKQAPNKPEITELNCTSPSCNAKLGTIGISTDEGYKLHKPSLSLSTSSNNAYTSYEQSKWLSLHLLTAVESQGVRKFTVPASVASEANRQQRRQIMLWVFTPDLLVSTSALKSNDPIRVAKILWCEEDSPDDQGERLSERLNRQALAEGELALRGDEVERLVQLLQASAEWLPRSARKFGDWDVGLLERFSKADLEIRRPPES